MDLKFSFGGATPDSGGAPLGSVIPLSAAASSNSSVLRLRVSRDVSGSPAGSPESNTLICDALSGDGVSYARIEREVAETEHLAAGVRSALARVGPELPEALLGSVTEVVLALGGDETAVLTELGIAVNIDQDPPALVDEPLQARTGIAAGTPVRFEA